MSDTRVAIVTGASRGIGAAIARRLARDGFAVVVNFQGSAEAADVVASAITDAGGSAITCKADVADPAAVAALFDAAEQAFGGVDVLVNNAGIQKLDALSEMADDDADALIRINLKGAFNMMREAARRMRNGGRVINLSSGTTLVLRPHYGMYAATKAGVEALTAVLAKEMRGRAIAVNAVLPGPVATELFLQGKSDEQLKQAAEQSPLGRLGEPDDIANVVSFLAGPEGGWINGQRVIANGAFA